MLTFYRLRLFRVFDCFCVLKCISFQCWRYFCLDHIFVYFFDMEQLPCFRYINLLFYQLTILIFRFEHFVEINVLRFDCGKRQRLSVCVSMCEYLIQLQYIQYDKNRFITKIKKNEKKKRFQLTRSHVFGSMGIQKIVRATIC